MCCLLCCVALLAEVKIYAQWAKAEVAWVESDRDLIQNLKSGIIVYQKVQSEELDVQIYNQAAVATGKGWFEEIGSRGSITVVGNSSTGTHAASHSELCISER